MERNLLTRGILIAVIVLAATWAAYPPSESINLGLDLQGGMYLVMRVDTDEAIATATENMLGSMENEFADRGITSRSENLAAETFEMVGVPADRDDEIEDEILDRLYPGWSFSRNGDRLSFKLTAGERSKIQKLSVDQAEETIRNRIDALGVSEPVVHDGGVGSDRIIIQLPGVDDPERVKEIIKSTAVLELHLVAQGTDATSSKAEALAQLANPASEEHIAVEQVIRDQDKQILETRWWVLEKRRVITGNDLRNSFSSSGEFGEPVVAFTLSREGGEKFAEVTGANIGRGLAIVLDNKIMSVANINSRIRDSGIIEGDFTASEVNDLVTVLRSGALPASMYILEERTIGPSLGRDSIEKGKSAGMIGGLLVILTMLMVYKLSGINAVVALTLNIVLVFGVLALVGATLTLPGIAGIVLTIGMAVDANVLVFERIREELRSGRTVKSAIAAGFQKALSSILDANFTTLIAAMFLFTFGTGPIRGFAVTLSIGIFASVFTAVIVSRFLFDLIYSRTQRADKLSI